MDEQVELENLGGDVRDVGFASRHKIIFDFVPNAQEFVVRLGHRFSWIGPPNMYRNVAESSFDSPDSSDRAEINLDFEMLPQPGFWSRIFGYTSQLERVYIVTRASLLYPRLYGYLGRAPTQEEAEVVAQHQATAFCQGTSWPALLVGIGLAREIWTAKKGLWHNPLPLRFPRKYDRRQPFTPGTIKVPFSGRVIQGRFAFMLQRMWRLSKYGAVTYLMGKVLMNTYLSTAEMRAFGDPRLKSLRDGHREMLEREKEEAVKALRAYRNRQARQDSTLPEPKVIRTVDQPPRGSSNDNKSSLLGALRRQRADSTTRAELDTSDDVSPTDSRLIDDGYTEEINARVNRSTDDSESTYSGNIPDQSEYNHHQTQSGSRQQQGSMSDDPMRIGNIADDLLDGKQASRSGAEPPNAPMSRSLSAGKGSAWDRIRRSNIHMESSAKGTLNSAIPSEQTDGRQHQELGQSQDLYGQVGVTAKDRAQQEFDALLDRERAGNEPDTKGGKW